MFITVTCPKCGRSIKAKKKFVLSTGCIPCLKCKIRIPLSKEQVEAYSPNEPAVEESPEGLPEAAPAVEDALPAQADGESVALPSEAEPEPAREPELIPELIPEPIPEPAPAMATEVSEDADAITPAIAAGSESESLAETGTTTIGPQIAFTCPYCQTTYPMRHTLAGKKIRCRGCSRIVKVAVDSPVIPGSEPTPPPPPPDDDIPVIYSPSEAPVAAPVLVKARTAPTALPEPPHEAGAPLETIIRLRKALSEAEERANSAEELLQQMTREKTTNDMAAFRKTRDLEAQLRDLTVRFKAREEEHRASGQGALQRSEVEALLKTLCEALDANLKQDMDAHLHLVDDLKRQLTQALK
jgi:transcription elongation factor Elf1